MKKLVRAAMLTAVMFVGANAQSVRDQAEEQGPQVLAATQPQGCYPINGVWVCTDD
jgi:hypothetical protein